MAIIRKKAGGKYKKKRRLYFPVFLTTGLGGLDNIGAETELLLIAGLIC
jgi:hypothetical protein